MGGIVKPNSRNNFQSNVFLEYHFIIKMFPYGSDHEFITDVNQIPQEVYLPCMARENICEMQIRFSYVNKSV